MNKIFFKSPKINDKFKQNLLTDFVSTYQKSTKTKNKLVFPFAFGFVTLLFAIFVSNYSPQSEESPSLATVSKSTPKPTFSENTVSFLGSMRDSFNNIFEKDNSLNNLDSDINNLSSELDSDADIISAINFENLD